MKHPGRTAALYAGLAVIASGLGPGFASGAAVSSWGSQGSGAGQFTLIGGVVAAANGDLYATDLNPGLFADPARVQQFTEAGTFVRQWGEFGVGDGQMNRPFDLATDDESNLYVVDSGNHRIQKFSSTGTFLDTFGEFGSGDGQFQSPSGIAVGPDGSVYVTDDSRKVKKFTAAGSPVTAWGGTGSAAGQFEWGGGTPPAVTNSQVFVADEYNERIQIFETNGTFKDQWALKAQPRAVAVGPSGDVFVVVYKQSIATIRQYSPSGSLIGSFDVPEGPNNLTVGPSGAVYVGTTGPPPRIFRIDPTEPEARLTSSVGNQFVLTGAAVAFSAEESFVPFSAPTEFTWDLGAGSFDLGSGPSPSLGTSFSTPGTKNVRVQVRAASGKTATAGTTVDVRPAPPPGAVGLSINGGDFATNDRDVLLDPVWFPGATTALISNDGGFGASGGTSSRQLTPPLSWRISSAGSERLPKTVYARYLGIGQDATTFTDDIILDTTTPIIEEATGDASARMSSSTASASAKKKYKIRVVAKAKLSGVSAVNASSRKGGGTVKVLVNPKKRGILHLKRTLKFKLKAKPRFVRVQNAAGTWSKWRKIG